MNQRFSLHVVYRPSYVFTQRIGNGENLLEMRIIHICLVQSQSSSSVTSCGRNLESVSSHAAQIG